MQKPVCAVICAINSQYIHSSLAPWCLKAGVDAYCHKGITAQVEEGTINEPVDAIVSRILAYKPDILGFCCYIWNISTVKQLIVLVKKASPQTVIVLGGPEVSYCAKQVLTDEPLVDYIISGEGEKPFALLLNALNKDDSTLNIPGLCYRNGGKIVVSQPYMSEQDPPSPYSDQYFQALNGRIAYLETSRGCPYSCAFCLSGRCGDIRFFDLDRAKKELLLLANSGTRTVKLVDRTFNANKKRANALFEFIIQNYGNAIPKGVCFHFEIAGDLPNDDMLALLATAPAGAIQLEIGLQSFNNETLAAINRKTNMDKLRNNIQQLIKNANIHIHIDLIAGLPYENITSFAQSFNSAYKLKSHMLQLGFLKLLHGSPMRENPQQFPCIYSKQPPYEVLLTPWLSNEELESLHSTADALDRLYNSGRFRRTLDYLLLQSGWTPFELFSRFGAYATEKGTDKLPLDDYTALFYRFFCNTTFINSTALRDVMVCDRLSANSSGRLPDCLRIADPELKKAVKLLETNETLRRRKGIKRGYALLYSKPVLIYADYTAPDPVTGEYKLNRFLL